MNTTTKITRKVKVGKKTIKINTYKVITINRYK